MLQQGFKKAGIDATIQVLPAAQWFDRLYTKRNHDGIAVNAGSLPFPWALIANYMMKAHAPEEPAEVPEGQRFQRSRLPTTPHSRPKNEAQYSASLKAVQRLMLTAGGGVPHDDRLEPERGTEEPAGRRLDADRRPAIRWCVPRLVTQAGSNERHDGGGLDVPHRLPLMRFLTPVLSLIGVLLAISMITFAIATALPGDTAEIRVGKRDDLTFEQRTALVTAERARLGLDKPVPIQFVIWLEKAIQGDLGVQEGGGSVGRAVLERIIPSLELAFLTLAISLPLAALLALRSVRRGKRVFSVVAGQLSTVGFVVPQFWLGILLVIFFAVLLGWLPASGYESFRELPVEHVKRMHHAADHAGDPHDGRLLPLHAAEPAGVVAARSTSARHAPRA